MTTRMDVNLDGKVVDAGRGTSFTGFGFDEIFDDVTEKKKKKLNTKGARKIHAGSGLVKAVGDDVRAAKALRIEELVVRAQAGDTDAFGLVYDNFVDQIHRHVFYRVPQEDAEDITETVFLKAWEKLHQYKPKQKSFQAWLFRIAHNLIVDTYRFKKDKDVVELSPDVPEYRREHNPIRMTEDSLYSDKLRRAISKLNKHYKQIVILKFINEMSNEEVAKVLKKSEGSIRILQFRALKVLKEELISLGVEF